MAHSRECPIVAQLTTEQGNQCSFEELDLGVIPDEQEEKKRVWQNQEFVCNDKADSRDVSDKKHLYDLAKHRSRTPWRCLHANALSEVASSWLLHTSCRVQSGRARAHVKNLRWHVHVLNLVIPVSSVSMWRVQALGNIVRVGELEIVRAKRASTFIFS